jgi:hypothetical protein
MVKKPLEEGEFVGYSTSPRDKRQGGQEDDDVDTLLVIGRHRWDVYFWFSHGDPIYETNSESVTTQTSIPWGDAMGIA